MNDHELRVHASDRTSEFQNRVSSANKNLSCQVKSNYAFRRIRKFLIFLLGYFPLFQPFSLLCVHHATQSTPVTRKKAVSCLWTTCHYLLSCQVSAVFDARGQLDTMSHNFEKFRLIFGKSGQHRISLPSLLNCEAQLFCIFCLAMSPPSQSFMSLVLGNVYSLQDMSPLPYHISSGNHLFSF